jgi:hypothetical protein
MHTTLDRIMAALERLGITPMIDGAEPTSFSDLADRLEERAEHHEAGGDEDGLVNADSPPVLMSLTPTSTEKDIVRRQEQLAKRYSSPRGAGGRAKKR